MIDTLIQKIIDLTPVIISLGAMATWFFKMKEDIRVLKISIKDSHERIDLLEKKHGRFENRLEEYMKEVNHRIDNCRESILSSVNNNMHMLLKALTKR